MNIAFIHNCFPAGGAERVTLDIAAYLQTFQRQKGSSDYHIHVYATAENSCLSDTSYDGLLKLDIVPSSPKDRSRAIEKRVVTQQIDILVQVVDKVYDMEGIKKRTGVKVVFANHGEPFWQRYPIMARRQKGILKKFLWKLYGQHLYQEKGKALRMAIRRSAKIYAYSDAYTVLCEAYRKQTCDAFGVSEAESHVVAIENSEKIRDQVHYEKEPQILYCGRLDNRYKRVDRLLRIWSRVQAELPGWELRIVGDGPDRAMLEKLASSLHLERIFFLGEHRNVQDFYDRASIVCLTSQSEGWPLCLTEAQASGVLPIAFACSAGVEEILGTQGEYGFLVPGFDEQEYSRVLVQVARLPEDRKRILRQQVVRKRAAYTPEFISAKWKHLFDSL